MALLVEKKEQLLYWPAAVSFHHAERSGLLHHTTTMLRAAQALLPIYPYLNRSLLLCGVIAHDLCKIDELSAGELGIASEYTKEGNLLGHIVQGVAHVREVGAQLGLSQEVLLLVEHMILSHHEIPEYGSPKPPLFPEAQMLHLLDMMDARMFAMHEALLITPKGAFSDRVRGIEELEAKIRASIESTLGISAKVTFVEPSSLPRSEGKAKRVIDNRTLR